VEHWDLDFCYEDATLGRFRTNYFYDQSGICGVFRIIPPKVPSFEELRLPDIVRRFTEYRVGIVLVTGPKSCGKTSTLAAMIDHVNRSRREHVITLEDPIEYVHPCKQAHISQREVGQHTQSFSNALRAALREAPDVILVGEMRDLETTSLAITAAETGHLVLASLHTPDSVRTISAVLDVFPPKEQGQIRSMLSESLRGIVSQQLIPSTDGKSLELALEVLVNKSSIANLIREERTYQIRGVMQTGRKDGMMLLDDSLLTLYRAGKISQEEVLTRASDEAYVTKELAGRKASEE
jgi:twitching motility protein PilT